MPDPYITSPPEPESHSSECFKCRGNIIDFESEAVKALPRHAATTNWIILQFFHELPASTELRQLAEFEAFLEENFGQGIWLVYHDHTHFAPILALSFVKRAIIYDDSFKVFSNLKARLELRTEAEQRTEETDIGILLHESSAEDASLVKAHLEYISATIYIFGDSHMQAGVKQHYIKTIAALDCVSAIDEVFDIVFY